MSLVSRIYGKAQAAIAHGRRKAIKARKDERKQIELRKLTKPKFAAAMRAKPTPSEAKLLSALLPLVIAQGWRLQSQVVIDPYIVDFLIPECRLVVEVDGGYHKDQALYDHHRDRFLSRRGYEVLHFTNGQVKTHLDRVLISIIGTALSRH